MNERTTMETRSANWPTMETDDAGDWAAEFFRLFPGTAIAKDDGALTAEDGHDLMRGWFANAIETGRAFG